MKADVNLDEYLLPALLAALALLLVTSCAKTLPRATPRLGGPKELHALPLPPGSTNPPKASNTFQPTTNWTLRWEDCQPQEAGSWYVVHQRDTLDVPWTLYALVTNEHSIDIPLTNTMSFFTVSAVDTNGQAFAVKECFVITR